MHNVKPFGDTMGDGMVQMSFTLPIPKSGKSSQAAMVMAGKMGLDEPYVAHEEEITPGFTFFVVYGRCRFEVDMDEVKESVASIRAMDMHETDAFIERNIGRNLRAVGACIETDAHTVGIDAILNMKGYAGDYGLERYEHFDVVNMGAQVKCEDLIAKSVEFNADAILVSTIVTQKDVHILHLTKLIDMLEAEGLRDRFVLVVGGPRINNALARELGYDVGFGKGSLPSHVATFLAERMAERLGKSK